MMSRFSFSAPEPRPLEAPVSFLNFFILGGSYWARTMRFHSRALSLLTQKAGSLQNQPKTELLVSEHNRQLLEKKKTALL
jgi:hypothetical protein